MLEVITKMSMEYCHNCDKNIDTDFNAEHFPCGEKCQMEDCDNEATDFIVDKETLREVSVCEIHTFRKER
jgi:hypothetical protein